MTAMTTTEYRTTRAAAMTEKALLEQVRQTCRVLGIHCYHTHDSRRSEPGFPDLVICGDRGVLYRELKTTKGRLTGPQNYWLERLRRAGQDAAVWRPEQLLDGTVARQLGEVR